MSLNLFPARAAIGRATVNGQQVDVLMTPEFSRALADLLQRVGGADGMDASDIVGLSGDLATLHAFDDPFVASAPVEMPNDDGATLALVGALVARVDALQQELALLRAGADFLKPLADLQVLINMQDNRPGVVKGTATGSRAGNVALASLLSALAKSGLVIDSTTV